MSDLPPDYDLTDRAGRPTWLTSDRPIARLVARPLAQFLHVEAAGGVLMLVAAVIALAWANSPWQDSYTDLWHAEALVRVGSFHVTDDLRHWVNDGLMALFFFVVGLEIKRELVTGDLRDRQAALLPIFAAVGGMVVPATIYGLINLGGDGASGWGVPMATDIAFAVGVLALLGDQVPTSAKVLLLALAIVDDVGAILVIAAFYTSDLSLAWLAAAVAGVLVVAALRRIRVWYLPTYVLVGVVVWWCTFQSGVHATLAGVVLGLLAPARPLLPPAQADQVTARLSADTAITADEVREASFALRETVSVAERLEAILHPWSSYVIVPLFALANAGLTVSWDMLSDSAGSAITVGTLVGLVVGKPLGILLAVGLALRLGVARLPEDLRWRHVAGLGALAGIGFTVSLFIGGLAFDDPVRQSRATLGVLAASAVAAAVGTLVLRTHRPVPSHPGDG